MFLQINEAKAYTDILELASSDQSTWPSLHYNPEEKTLYVIDQIGTVLNWGMSDGFDECYRLSRDKDSETQGGITIREPEEVSIPLDGVAKLLAVSLHGMKGVT